MTFHNFLVSAWVTQCCVHKILRIVRGAENPVGPNLPDCTLVLLLVIKHAQRISKSSCSRALALLVVLLLL